MSYELEIFSQIVTEYVTVFHKSITYLLTATHRYISYKNLPVLGLCTFCTSKTGYIPSSFYTPATLCTSTLKSLTSLLHQTKHQITLSYCCRCRCC